MGLKGPKIIERSTKDQEIHENGTETWIESQCQELEACLREENSKKAYQLVKDLTTEKEGKSTTIQDKPGKCLTKEPEILNR